MTRLFYDCPIKAAYMSKYFAVGFEDFNQDTSDAGKVALASYGDGSKIYVEAKSEALFEPKEGDIGNHAERYGLYYFDSRLQRWDSAGIRSPEDKDFDDLEIIMRDGKHFFYPMKETSN